MGKLLCDKKETGLGIIFLSIFVILITVSTIFRVTPILHSIIQSSIFTTLLLGIVLCIQTLIKIGSKNFVGKSMTYFLLASTLTSISLVTNIFNFNVSINKYIWIFVSVFMVMGLLSLLTTYKLRFPKYVLLEGVIVFFISLFTLSLFGGWPQFLNSLLVTASIMTYRVTGKKINCGIFFLSTGIILLVISNIMFAHRYWNEIAFFGDISDITLLVSWFSIVTGIFFTKKRHA